MFPIIKAAAMVIFIVLAIITVWGAFDIAKLFFIAPPIYENVEPSWQYYLTIIIISLSFFLPILGVLVCGFLLTNASYPNIITTEQGLKAQTLLGSSKWIPWQSIKKVRIPLLGFENIVIVSIRGRSILFFLNGLLYLTGSDTFLISSQISVFEKLMKLFREKRPDLFPK